MLKQTQSSFLMALAAFAHVDIFLCVHKKMHYVLETPTYKYFRGTSMRKIVEAVNANITDKRRQLRNQGLSYLKAGHSKGQLYKSHALFWFETKEGMEKWITERGLKPSEIIDT